MTRRFIARAKSQTTVPPKSALTESTMSPDSPRVYVRVRKSNCLTLSPAGIVSVPTCDTTVESFDTELFPFSPARPESNTVPTESTLSTRALPLV